MPPETASPLETTSPRPYDVLVALNYYAPYVSGVTEAARVTAEGLVARGYRVLVIAGHHDPSTPRIERIGGVDVLRTPVVARIGKGIVSPSFVPTVLRWARKAKLVHLHLPMLEAGAIALGVRGVPLVTTYQCDVTLPAGLFNSFQTWALDRSHRIALRRSDVVAVTSEDYARASRLAGAMAGRTQALPAPAVDRSGGQPRFRDGDGLHVGFLGRIVEEKGLEYLVRGFRELGPDARLLIGGDFAKVAGGSVVDRVREAIGDDPRIRLMGFVADEALPDFYASLDVFALPSVNSLEAFGLVQVEAMMQGIPVVASDLPGVRMPVRDTGFGRIVPPRDAPAIAEALREISDAGLDPVAGAAQARARYLDSVVVEQHAELFDRLLRERGLSSPR
ncbi:glycosyltransferase family 4 protein [Cellulomonas fengjieae]|uniref:D-inositol 3-phosphate glycosyltransferase n=1 Tax=Cellulomonas fengjieae TaxID=2819978 RepID=A0ABS3SDL5_9CELL|nr:glycosyltransferase family 4 protein [Cellulomonas fengjieae]MBO3083835.1 glycosyltransferase family 4 protein [Cellulomonas fengjieae]MBO3101416.1 glycosyltransferase family 4 protein [Cellulomonas fengjieae]QVI64879.1 glycosyltransferase family 4 protein [Cellulomonas fengjieae]